VGETEVGRDIAVDGLSISTVFCTSSTISLMLSSLSSCFCKEKHEPSKRCANCGCTYLDGFDALGHSGDGGLWAPYRPSIETLLRQVKSGSYGGQDLGAALGILLYLRGRTD
jgi:protein-arginine kinase activator protein McsA